MAMFVLMTAYLYQKGSAESNDPDREEPAYPLTSESPWPAKQGGWIRALYSYSLPLVLFALFLVSFGGHAVAGLQEYREDHPTAQVIDYLGSAQFWFESMQNWQSEFMSVVALGLFSIVLRQKGSPESKPVNQPTWETGAD